MSAWLETMGWMLACAAVLVGLGAAAQRALARAEATSPARAFWSGLFLSMPLLFAWHLFAPVDSKAAGALALLGGAGLVWERRALLAGIDRLRREHRLSLVAWVLLWCALPALTLQPLTCIDGGLYFVAAVKWHAGFAQVPGLQATNPFSTLNLGAFVLTAAVGTGPFANEGHLVFNGLLAWWGLPLGIGALERLARAGSPRALAVTLAAGPGVDLLLDDRMSCPSADVGVAWLGLAMTAMALGPPRSSATLKGSLLGIVLAPLFKLSLAPFALVLALLVVWRHRALLERRALAWACALAGLAWLPFLAGNVIVSGYPLYPSSALGFPVDWALPHEMVARVGTIIRSYSMHDGIQGTPTRAEQLARLLLMNRGVLLPAVLLLTGTLATLWRVMRGARLERSPLAAAWVFACLWFWLAPDPRFAGAGLWVAGAMAWWAALPPGPDLATRLLVTGVSVLLVFGGLPYLELPSQLPRGRPTLPNNSGDPRFKLSDGTELLDCTPRGGQYPQCWSVPCAALFPVGLTRRDAGDLSRGFRLPPDAVLVPISVE